MQRRPRTLDTRPGDMGGNNLGKRHSSFPRGRSPHGGPQARLRARPGTGTGPEQGAGCVFWKGGLFLPSGRVPLLGIYSASTIQPRYRTGVVFSFCHWLVFRQRRIAGGCFVAVRKAARECSRNHSLPPASLSAAEVGCRARRSRSIGDGHMQGGNERRRPRPSHIRIETSNGWQRQTRPWHPAGRSVFPLTARRSVPATRDD
jgi:hypothetical protein